MRDRQPCFLIGNHFLKYIEIFICNGLPVFPKSSTHIVFHPGYDMGTERTTISPEKVGISGEKLKRSESL